MAVNRSNITNELVITAMDRFVWFILLVVTSHLVTEFTRVTGYARGTRNDVVLLNDTTLQARTVQNMLLYPGQEYSIYGQQQQQQQQTNQYYNRFQSNANANANNNQQPNSQIIAAPSANANAEQSFPFSLRPIIDSIFEIPISTLRAVNNLVARLAGGYRQAQTTTQSFAGKSAAAAAAAISDVQKSAMPLVAVVQDLRAKPSKKSLMREVNA